MKKEIKETKFERGLKKFRKVSTILVCIGTFISITTPWLQLVVDVLLIYGFNF